MGTKARSDVTATNQQLTNGLQQYFAKKTLLLDGKPWPATAVIASFAKENTLVASTAAAKAAWQAQVAALKAQTAANDQLRTALHAQVLETYGRTNRAVLSAFGYSVPQRSKRSPQSSVTAAKKAAATRAARHTMSRKQKLAIHGAVATQPAAQPASDAPAQPAPAVTVATK